MQEAFYLVNVVYNEDTDSSTARERIKDCWLEEETNGDQRAVRTLVQTIRKVVLNLAETDTKEKESVLRTLKTLGNLSTTILTEWMEYIPRRTYAQCARRLGMKREAYKEAFKQHGYESGWDLLEHVRGIIQYYKEPRSGADTVSSEEVVQAINGRRKRKSAGSCRRKPHFMMGLTTEKEEFLEKALNNLGHEKVPFMHRNHV